MAATLWFKTFLLLSFILTMSFSTYGMVEGFQGGMQAKYSLEQGGMKMNVMSSIISRKLMEGGMLDYDDTGANTKHEPRKKPGKP